MAEAQIQETDPNDPLEILRASLMQEQVAATEESALRIADSGRNMVVNEGQAQTQERTFEKPKPGSVVITNASIDALYDRVAGTKYVATLPAGSRVTSSPNVITKTLPSGEIELHAKQIVPNVPPVKVFQAQQEAYSRPQGAVFNLENEEEKLKTLTGEERLNAVTKLLSNVGQQMTQRRQAIGQQAAVQSGFTSAQVALDRALQIEQLPNAQFGGLSFAARFGVPSAQTVQAQEFQRAAQITMTQLEESMLKKDAEYTKYLYAQDRLMKIESRTAQRQMDREDRAAAKADALAEAIPQHQVAAYQVLHPGTSSEEAVAQLAKAQKTNPAEFIATRTTAENVYDNLVHPELAVRQGTLAVLKEHDKANNAGYENADKTPTTEKLKKYIANPSALEQDAIQAGLISKDEAGKFQTQIAGADPKAKASKRQEYQALLLRKFVEKDMENNLSDMRNWKATEVGAGTALSTIIASVTKGSLNSRAPMSTVVDMYITDPTLKDPNGAPIPYEQRLATLQAALTGAMGNQFKTMLYPDVSDIQNKLLTSVNNMAARSYVRAKTIRTSVFSETEQGAVTGLTSPRSTY